MTSRTDILGRGLLVPVLLALSALLPYLPGGLRVEHLVVPAIAGYAVLRARGLHPETFAAVGALIVALLALAVSSYFSWETGLSTDAYGAIVRLAMPALMLMSFPLILSQISHPAERCAIAIVFFANICTIFSLLSLVSGYFLELMVEWTPPGEDTVWQMARDIGRITGIFNQPLEAGIFYSVALFSVLYSKSNTRISIYYQIASFILIVVGGTLTFSKNFIVLGVALAMPLAVMLRLISLRLALAIGVVMAGAIGLLAVNYNMNYVDSLITLYYEGGLISAVSAGRFGLEESVVWNHFYSLWISGDWIYGRGLGSQLPLDNGYLEFFYQGGIVALAGYVGALLALAIYAFANRAFSEARLLAILLIYIAAASMGGPVISANRANMALMLLVGACLASVRQHRAQAPSTNERPALNRPSGAPVPTT